MYAKIDHISSTYLYKKLVVAHSLITNQQCMSALPLCVMSLQCLRHHCGHTIIASC